MVKKDILKRMIDIDTNRAKVASEIGVSRTAINDLVVLGKPLGKKRMHQFCDILGINYDDFIKGKVTTKGE